MIEKTGEYYKLFSYVINDVKYYFVTSIKGAEVIYGFKNREDAEESFEISENASEFWENQTIEERIGKHYKLFSTNINGVKHYYISNKENSLIGVYATLTEALNMFKIVEEYVKKD